MVCYWIASCGFSGPEKQTDLGRFMATGTLISFFLTALDTFYSIKHARIAFNDLETLYADNDPLHLGHSHSEEAY